jgi:hypothetical protein
MVLKVEHSDLNSDEIPTTGWRFPRRLYLPSRFEVDGATLGVPFNGSPRNNSTGGREAMTSPVSDSGGTCGDGNVGKGLAPILLFAAPSGDTADLLTLTATIQEHLQTKSPPLLHQ